MKMLPVRPSVVLLLACTALVSGCGRGKAAQAPKQKGSVAQYVAVSRGTIAVEGGLLPLSAAVPGVVDAVKVHVGDHVHDGQVLATLKSGDARAAVDIARGKLAQAQAQAQLIALQLKAARQHARTLPAIPPDMRDPCDMAINTFHPNRILSWGMPLQEWDRHGRGQKLVDFKSGETVDSALFTLPKGFVRYTPEHLPGR